MSFALKPGVTLTSTLFVFCRAADGAPKSGGVRSISAGYGTIGRLAEAEAEVACAAASRAAAGDASGMPTQPLRRGPGGSADSGQRLQNLSFNVYGDLVVRRCQTYGLRM